MPEEIRLDPFDPGAVCSLCQGDEIDDSKHGQAIAVFHGTSFACSPYALRRDVAVRAHMCRKCQNCGHSWMEAVLSAA